jgi:G3E family GTPase
MWHEAAPKTSDAQLALVYAAARTMTSPTLPVHVLTGYLGSGKTTLLNALLVTPGLADAAVIVNELGDVGIDHLLVRHVREDVVILPSGCICCSLRNDLVATLTALVAARDGGSIPAFSRVLVETTGIAEPGPIVQTLVTHPELTRTFHLDGLITCVDAELGAPTLDAHVEAQLQVALCDRVVLTKLDRASPAQHEATLTRIRSLNPQAKIAEASMGQLSPQFLLAVGHLDPRRVERAQHVPHAAVQSTSVRLERPVRFRDFSLWVSMFTQLNAPRLLRLKAVISVEGEERPIAVQAVQHIVYPPLSLPAMPELKGRSFVVMLTQGLSAEQLDEVRQTLEAMQRD